MNRKPNAPKCILGVFMVVLLVIGGLATTTVRLSTNKSNLATAARLTAGSPVPQGAPGCGTSFEGDGNPQDDPAVTGEDWDTVVGDGTAPIPKAGSVAVAATFVQDIGSSDRIYTGGSTKDFIDINNWRHTIGSVPDKDEINDAYAALYNDPSGDKILVFGGDRFAQNGDSQIGFWFFQNEIAPITSGPLAGTFSGVHRNGDLLILSKFTKGGTLPTLQVFKWNGTASPPDPNPPDPCNPPNIEDNSGTLCDITASATQQSAKTNQFAGVPAPWPYTPKQGPAGTIPAGGFFEGCLNLSSLGLAGECFNSFLLETRSSQSTDAVLKDFALGKFVTCGLTLTKTPQPAELCAFNLDGSRPTTTYTYHVCNTNSTPLFVDITDVDDNGTPGNPGDDVSYTVVTNFLLAGGTTSNPTCQDFTRVYTPPLPSSGDLVVTNTATAIGRVNQGGPANVTVTATATVTVHPNPSCSVSVAPTQVCAGGSATFTANPTGGTAPYTFLWDTGATTSSISVSNAQSNVTHTVIITDSKGCQTSCSGTLIVNPNPTCTVTVNPTEICAGGSGTFTANPSGGTAPFSFLWDTGATTSSITVSNAQSTVSHSVTITDSKGCTTSCSGTLVVNPNPTVAINSAACNVNATTIQLTATPSSGTGPFTFQWSGDSSATTQSITVGPGTYTVTVTDSKGCTATATRKVGICTD